MEHKTHTGRIMNLRGVACPTYFEISCVSVGRRSYVLSGIELKVRLEVAFSEFSNYSSSARGQERSLEPGRNCPSQL